ncbi:hypothetical protein BO99DRAFT_327238 [Aspergillus violaceofuscus CBS 115571]|uniref:Uncharacterized protein n=1 Tax=Aspergillus violaceofuscus (strain CBS 115571) TaxID=1450538 RepID=A0A2V5HDQ9_ASPV1|nr:hypothetical protein BO99DRAFT_327238 [Aspergillus violaceofuscus CBS 115571]
MQPSKRLPTMKASDNYADRLEKKLQLDGFNIWGFVVYRCTYQSESDWEEFMRRFLYHVPRKLQPFNGLNLMATFCLTVFQDPSFDGATVAVLREHFNKWAAVAVQEEHGRTLEQALMRLTCRYRCFIKVDQAALESVLNAPDPTDPETIGNFSSYVRMVNDQWCPETDSDEEEEAEPLEGCTLEDVGGINVLYDEAEFQGFYLVDHFKWEEYNRRPPEVISFEAFI